MTAPKSTGIHTNPVAMTHEQEFARIDRDITGIRSTLTEVQTDLAGMPGRLMALLDQRHQPTQDGTWKWAFGVILSLIGGGFLLLWQADGNVRSEVSKQSGFIGTELHEHIKDKHPTSVQAEVRELSAKLEAATTLSEREYVRRHEYERQQSIDKLALASEMAAIQNVTAVDIARMTARQELILQGMIESMKLGGVAGRDAAENRGRVAEALKSLQREMDGRGSG